MVKATFKIVTPSMAAKWLERNTKNRRLSLPRVNAIAADIMNNSFVTTHQGIAFDEDGNLLDGQHRLHAIVNSNIPVELLVTTGLPASKENGVLLSVQDVIDSNSNKRSIGQQLSLSHGYPNGNFVAAAAKVIHAICTGENAVPITTAQTLYILKHYADDIEATLSAPWPAGFRRASIYGTLSFCRHANPVKVDEFTNKLATMEEVPSGSPVLAFYRWNQTNGGIAGSGARLQMCRAVAYSVSKFIDGNSCARVSAASDAFDRFLAAQKSRVRAICDICSVGPVAKSSH